ncbi:MAG: phosphatidate cytidylyltransferase [Bacteroidales bacterium]|nr:phosphatidate cytidylyltransferase [Bacteroidales bacterium]
MKDIFKRSLTGTLLVLVMIAAIIGGEIPFILFFTLLTIGTMWEFYGIAEKMELEAQKIWGIIGGIALFYLFYLTSIGLIKSNMFSIFIAWALMSFVIELFRNKTKPYQNIALTWFGILYIALPISMLLSIAYRENIYQYNHHLVLSYFILIWTYDTMAYVCGLLFGKRKLFERISPKKTWEGAVGGLVFALIAAYILSYFYKELTVFQWGIFATLISVFGTLGDLTESMLKRSIGIKDSGNILPGHGGLLDRFDAMFLAIPAVYLYLQFI